MSEDVKRLKLDCVAIAASECYKYDADGRRVSLSETEIVAHATEFYKFLTGETSNV